MKFPAPKYDFDADLALSKVYENKFANYLKSLGVNEVWLAPGQKHEDYDIIAGDYQEVTYEIKIDRYMETTGNFCLETMSCLENNSLGWFFKTKAQKIVIFYNETDFVWIDFEDLKDAWYYMPIIWTKKEIKQSWGTTICWLADCKKIPNLRLGSINEN